MRVGLLPRYLPNLFASRVFAVVLMASLVVLFALAFDVTAAAGGGSLGSGQQPDPFRWAATVAARG
jgi:hypothetical protein